MEIIPPNLTQYQKDIIFSPKRFTVTIAATKVGKTYSHMCWLFGKAMEKQLKAGCNYWWVAPIYPQSKIAYRRLKNYLLNVKGFEFNESELFIKTPNNAYLWFKSAEKPDNLYGEDVYAAVFDEFTRAREESWYALRSTLTATKGPCKLIGNYTGNGNWGYQLTEKAKLPDSEYEYFKINAWDAVDAGILDREEIEQAQKDLPEPIFNALYLAEGEDSPDQLIKSAAITDLFTNEYVPTGEMSITADIAFYGSDRFVVYVWSGNVVVDVVVVDRSGPEEVEKILRAMAIKHSVRRSRMVYDADGLGQYLKGYLKDAIPFNNGGTPLPEENKKVEYKNLKSQCYFRMAKNINDGNYYIAKDLGKHKTTLMQELQAVRNNTYGKDGKLSVLPKDKVREIIGRSPDFSDAMMMKEWLNIKGESKSWVDHL